MTGKKERPFVFPVMKKAIEELFQQGNITKDDLEKFQEKYWEQMVPNFSQTLKLLDIHDVSRHSILWNINDRLLETVKSRIQARATENNDDRKQQKLWQKLIRTGMTYIHHPYMRSAIMMVLGQMNSIKSRHVSLIVDNDYLYKDAPLPVLRHIWMLHENKFKDELTNVLQTYQQSLCDSLLDALHASITSSSADALPLLYWPPRRRRRDPTVVKIVEMIGDNQTLYDKTLEILRQESARLQAFMEKSSAHRRSLSVSGDYPKRSTEASPVKGGKSTTPKKDDPSPPPPLFISPALLSSPQALYAALLCTVRFDLLMSFNEAKLDRICMADPVHHFVWCMDACIKSKKIDRRHAIELASHLKRHRKRKASVDLPASELGLDQDTSEDWNPGLEEKGVGGGRKRASRGQRSSEKRAHSNDDEDATPKKTESPTVTNFERGLKMVCRDPWVVYTVCSSLLRSVIRGLYEDKSPRNIPEVPFLVHLLMIGLESDLTPPEIAPPTVIPEPPRSKRSRKQSTSESVESQAPEPEPKSEPATVLITQVLPAVAQLHLSTWRGQLCEEIRNTANRIWPKSGDIGASTPPAFLQRRLDSTAPFSVTVPPIYLAQPVGHLFLQYHALFALERREWTVLRALLRAAASASQVTRPKTSSTASLAPSRAGKSTPAPPPPSQIAFGFRWRPECLQALALGIASLSAASDDSSSPSHPESSRSDKPEKTLTAAASSSQTGDNLSPPPGGLDPGEKFSTAVVTRAELASLLRASLPLQTDLQLLVLAQAARLVPPATVGPPITPNTPSAVSSTPMPSFFGPDMAVAAKSGGGERERFINILARHVDVMREGEESVLASTPPMNSTLSAVFKSSNPKVIEALETLRRDMERPTTISAIPIMPTSKPASGKPQSQFATPLSPLSGVGSLQQYSSTSSGSSGVSSPTCGLMRPPAAAPPQPTSRYRPGRYGAFPMATPLTNPGLSMPPPPTPSYSLPRSPLSDYRPPSPLGGGGYPTYATPSHPDMGMEVHESGVIGVFGGGGYSAAPTGSSSMSPPEDLMRYAAPPSMIAPSRPPPSPSPP